jgi:formylglycine-generating enzyme required for sulfatase activity
VARIFISYRREDTAGYAGRLYDRLSQKFGCDNLFRDIDSIDYGLNFVEVIQKTVASCDVLLAVIGRQWLSSTDKQGRRRLDNPKDFVCLEIVTALERKIRVIPVLVGGASMPLSTELPDALQPLVDLNALLIGDHFHPDVDRLIKTLESVLYVPLPPVFTNSIGMEFVLIPAGIFTMGSSDVDAEAYEDEKPAHRVTISHPFYLGKYLVTQAQWVTVMERYPNAIQSHPKQPVTNVSWHDALAFIVKLSERDGGMDYFLPTEAQWEYACRAGTATPRYDSDVNAIAWYRGNSDKAPHPVGQKSPNAWGLYDMLGNAYEWCRDGRRKYTGAAVVDPLGPTDADAERVLRGGGWDRSVRRVRAANRITDHPGHRHADIGFRVASSDRRR